MSHSLLGGISQGSVHRGYDPMGQILNLVYKSPWCGAGFEGGKGHVEQRWLGTERSFVKVKP